MNGIFFKKGYIVHSRGLAHGGEDGGAVGNGIIEKSMNLENALYMYDRFKELGIPVKMVRTTDETVNPDERVKRVLNAFGNSEDVIVVSNHINAGGGKGNNVGNDCIMV